MELKTSIYAWEFWLQNYLSIIDSNHYEIAGYYSHMETRNGLVGMSMTYTQPLMMSTRAKKVIVQNLHLFSITVAGCAWY